MVRGEVGIAPELEVIRRRVIAAAIRVHRALGPGYREGIYQKALAHALQQDGLRVSTETWLDVVFEGLVLRNALRVDMIVEDSVLIELKAVEALHAVHRDQVVSYLKASNLSLGLLFNFNVPVLMRDGHERVVHPRHLRAA